MFKIGDLMIYSGHGICRVDDICDKTYAGITKTYYILHPIENSHQLTISTPVDNQKAIMLKMMDKDEALTILESFRSEGIEWIEKPQLRAKVYADIVNTGIRLDIAKVANTLLKKKRQVEQEGKKFYEHDLKLLIKIENTLYKELAIALKTTKELIDERVSNII